MVEQRHSAHRREWKGKGKGIIDVCFYDDDSLQTDDGARAMGPTTGRIPTTDILKEQRCIIAHIVE